MRQMQTQIAEPSSLQVTDEQAAAVAVAPRVTLQDIEASIAFRHDFRGLDVVAGDGRFVPGVASPLDVLSVCFLVLTNGFTVIGKSAPASVENFDAELGRRFAYEDAVRQIWPLMGFALRDRLWRDKQDDAAFNRLPPPQSQMQSQIPDERDKAPATYLGADCKPLPTAQGDPNVKPAPVVEVQPRVEISDQAQAFSNGLSPAQMDVLDDIRIAVKRLIVKLQTAEALPPHRSLSCAITKLEEADHWLADRARKPA